MPEKEARKSCDERLLAPAVCERKDATAGGGGETMPPESRGWPVARWRCAVAVAGGGGAADDEEEEDAMVEG